jgi:hypothetical protein
LGYLVKQFSSTNSYFFIKHIYLARKFESVWNMEYVDSCSIHYIKLQILLTYCHNEFFKNLWTRTPSRNKKTKTRNEVLISIFLVAQWI